MPGHRVCPTCRGDRAGRDDPLSAPLPWYQGKRAWRWPIVARWGKWAGQAEKCSSQHPGRPGAPPSEGRTPREHLPRLPFLPHPRRGAPSCQERLHPSGHHLCALRGVPRPDHHGRHRPVHPPQWLRALLYRTRPYRGPGPRRDQHLPGRSGGVSAEPGRRQGTHERPAGAEGHQGNRPAHPHHHPRGQEGPVPSGRPDRLPKKQSSPASSPSPSGDR